jgi:hypothetical protein
MTVIAPIGKQGQAVVRDQFVSAGKECGLKALKKLDDSCVGETYRKYKSSITRVLQKQPKDERMF